MWELDGAVTKDGQGKRQFLGVAVSVGESLGQALKGESVFTRWSKVGAGAGPPKLRARLVHGQGDPEVHSVACRKDRAVPATGVRCVN